MDCSTEPVVPVARPAELTVEWVQGKYRELCERADQAGDASGKGVDWISLAREWNGLKAYLAGERARRNYAFRQDMNNAAAEEADRFMREEIIPPSETGDALLGKALLASPERHRVGAHFGPHLLERLDVKQAPLAPVNSELRVQVGQLALSYDKLVASGEVQVEGETMTLARARSRMGSANAGTRRAAYEAYFGWFNQKRELLAEIYSEQVRLRTQMGERLGFPNFLPLGYAGMQRTAYGPKEVALFHAAVREHVTPLFRAQAEQQAKALGVETLKPWDAGYFPGRSLPDDVAEPVAQQLERFGRIFARLSPELAEHFERMRRENLIDLENRKGKAAGAFCTSFPDERRVAIFCNSTGNEDDIGTLAHEMGHAFQCWESQAIEAVDLRWPTSDAAEVHSMGMEYLTLPYLDEFLSPDQLKKFTTSRWAEAVRLLCYVCVVDAFQQWVYETPSASPADRDKEWARLQGIYMPGIDYTGDAAAYRSSRWYAQLHIFRYPFYYIDYALAETGAMQLAVRAQTDPDGALETYLNLCRLGGTQDVIHLFAQAGLRSPFDGECMRDLMAYAARQLQPAG
ncbi:MAG: M3 family oligoendopeptidase [Planctomycetes bacterium]|nr:M3 family oligoendopeptidase [Planctomycetota bacterium]